MVVMVVIVLLITMAIPIYEKQVIRSRETVLKSDLFTLRVSINQFMFDQQKAPRSLDDLVTGGYLKEVPVDPLTKSQGTWKTVPEDSNPMSENEPGIRDVHSGAPGNGLDGTPYNTW